MADFISILRGQTGQSWNRQETPTADRYPNVAAPSGLLADKFTPAAGSEVDPFADIDAGDEMIEFGDPDTMAEQPVPAPIAEPVAMPMPSAPSQQFHAPAPDGPYLSEQAQREEQGVNYTGAGGRSGNGMTANGNTIRPEDQSLADDVFKLINGGASRQQIYGFLKSQNIDPSTVQNLDAAITWRDNNPGETLGVVASGPVPVERVRGEDQGMVASAALGVADGVTLGFGVEIDAGINSAANMIGAGDGQTYDERLAENRGLLDDAQHYNPVSYIAGQVGGSLALPGVGEIAAARGLGNVTRAGIEGAAYGGLYSAGSSEGDLGDRALAGAKGAAFGGAVGGAVGGAFGRVADRIATNRVGVGGGADTGSDILSAANRLNEGAGVGDELIRPLPAHVARPGGIVGKSHNAMQDTIIGGNLSGLRGQNTRFYEAGDQAAERIANREARGSADDLVTTSERSLANGGGLGDWNERMRQTADRLYGLAEDAAGDAVVRTPATINRIDNILDRWGKVPGGVEGQRAIEELREQLANGVDGNGTWTIDGLRRLRTSFGDRLESTNRTVREEARTLWGPLTNDIVKGLRAAGNSRAANAYTRADGQYARMTKIKNEIENIVGPEAARKSAQMVSDKIFSMSVKESGRLAEALRGVSPAGQAEIRGALINRIGASNAGRRIGSEDGFSMNNFATNWSKMSSGAKADLFPARTVQDLDDLSIIAMAQKKANLDRNNSKSGSNLANVATIGASGGGVVGAATGAISIPAAASVFAVPLAFGIALGRPGVARAMIRLGEGQRPETTLRVLATIASRQPTGAGAVEVLNLRREVAERMGIEIEYDPFSTIPEGEGTVPLDGPTDGSSMPMETGEPDPFDSIDPGEGTVEF